MNRQQSWTTADQYLLDELRGQDWSLQQIADHMGRTVDSVRNKAHKMDRARDGRPRHRRGRTVRERLADFDARDLADALVERGWKCFAPKQSSETGGKTR